MLPRWRRERGGLACSSVREGRELGTQRLGHCSVTSPALAFVAFGTLPAAWGSARSRAPSVLLEALFLRSLVLPD